ncbi:MAG: formyl transferase [Rhizobiales bacterium]|nr:formyl transferase [Hyphomicrobiales bacterium]MBA67765.1 formyl transferase [Hyphomicrobiales bacterium]
MTDENPIIILTAGGSFPWIVINAVADAFPDVVVLREQPESKVTFIRRKARLMGWVSAIGQFMMMVVSRLGKKFTGTRASRLMREHGASDKADPRVAVHQIPSVNAPETLALIDELQPAAILSVSCRILKRETLSAISCPVLNFHPGITPRYRGMWSGYWARAMDDIQHYGTTVHMVDLGVDSGAVIYRKVIEPSPRETIFTDTILQTAAARDIAVAALKDAVAGELKPLPADGVSRQYFHPTLWFWVWRGLTKGVW